MKKGVFGIFILLMFLNAGCTKDVDDETSILGSWIETAPVEERTRLFFSADKKLHIVKDEDANDVFNYKIKGKTLYLKLSNGSAASSEFFIDLIDQDKLKLENLYPSIPEGEPTFIIFVRK